jgi:hypothetical protein
MKNGICPKCEGEDVRLVNGRSPHLSIGLGFFGSANLVYYVCTGCGYVELFVESRVDLPKIAENYPKVKPKEQQ